MKKIIAEFKEFIMRGNVIDMAIGVVVGGAFTSVVNSLVNDIIMPGLGYLIGGIDFSHLKIVLEPAQGDSPEVAINYGMFINSIISFLMIALVIFLVVKAVNTLRTRTEALMKSRQAEAEEAQAQDAEPTERELLAGILEELKVANEKAQSKS